VSGWRTALRVAWRQTRRARGRSALIIAMITVPVAALAFLATGYDTFTLTPDEQADRTMGAAQAIATWPYDAPVQQRADRLVAFTPTPSREATARTADRLLALLPPGSRAVPELVDDLTVHTAAGIGTVGSLTLDYTDPITRGLLRQLSGRAPAAPDEVDLTPAASERTGTGIGGTVTTADGTRTLRVVGIVEQPDDLAAETVVFQPSGTPTGSISWLLDTPTPITWDQVKQLNMHGITMVSRQVLTNPPGPDELYPGLMGSSDGPPAAVLVLVGGLALLEVVLLAGPAFAVGARRRQRDLALVAATGGTPAHLRRIVLADGVVLGAIAAGIGLVLGIAVAALLRPLLETFNESRAGAFRIYPLAQVAIAGLAVLTGVLAALVPAWTAARQDVVTALRGRRGVTGSRRRWVVIGLVLLGAGAGLAIVGAATDNLTVILAGVIAAELGLVLCTPAIVGLAGRLGRLLPLAARIALRDTSRNRTAAAPAISAVMAVVIGTLAVSVVLMAQTTREAEAANGRPGDVYLFHRDRGATVDKSSIPPGVITTMRAILPVSEVHEVRWLACPDAKCYVSVRTPPAQDCPYSQSLLGHSPDAGEQRAARSDPRCDGVGSVHNYFTGSVTGLGGTRVYSTNGAVVVVVDDQAAGAVAQMPPSDAEVADSALRAGKIVVSDPRYLDNGRVTLGISLPGNQSDRPDRTITGAGFALPHQPKAPIVMLTENTATALGLTSDPLTTMATTSRMPTTDEQDRLQAALGQEFDVRVNRGSDNYSQYLTILAIGAGVVTLAAAALATGLAAADRRADLGTLAAVGASPRVRRALSLWQSGVIAGLGSVLGTAAGLGTSIAVLSAFNTSYADQWPAPTPFPIGVPWFNVVVALAVVPVIAMLGAGLLTRSRLPIERRL
jgi:putative ABC transport system permease protein